MRQDQWFFLILVTAVVFRLLFFVTVAHPEARHGAFELRSDTDEADYHRLASNLAASGKYQLDPDGPATALRPPGTVLPIAALYLIFGPRPMLGVIYVAACSMVLVVLFGALARATGGSARVERIAMLLGATTPTLVYTATGIWSDTPNLLFTLLSLWLLLRARNRDPRLLMLAAASLGAAYLNRPSAAIFAALAAGWLLVGSKPRLRFATAVAFVLVAALPGLAWGLWNAATMGAFYAGNTQSTVALWQANNPVTAGLRPPAIRYANGVDLHREAEDGSYLGSWIPLAYIAEHDPWRDRTLPELEAEAWLKDQAIGFALEHPYHFLRLLGYKALRIATAEPTAPSVLAEGPTKRRLKRLMTFGERWFFLAVGSAGLVLLWRRDPDGAAYYLLYCAGGLAVVFIAYPNARILLPVTATLIVPAAMAIERTWEKIRATRGSRRGDAFVA